MTRVNVLGCCCSRDFITAEDTKKGIYAVPSCITIMNPLSLYLGREDNSRKTVEQSVFSSFRCSAGLNYRSRITMLDNNKQVFDYIKGRSSDFILVDFADLRIPVLKYEGSCVTASLFVETNLDRFRQEFGEFERVSIFDFDETFIRDFVRWYCDRLLELYRPEQIVLNEIFCADRYLTRRLTIRQCKDETILQNKKKNGLFERVNSLFKDMIKEAMVIPCPDNCFASAFNKWGLHTLHYSRRYYEYGNACLNVAVNQKLPVEERKSRIGELCRLYSEILKIELDSYRSNRPEKKLNDAQ